MELLVLGTVAGLGYVLVSPSTRGAPYKSDAPIDENFKSFDREFTDVGISMGAARTAYLDMTNLNEAWKPRTAPRQKPTDNLQDVYRSEADSAAYLTQNGSSFYFQWQGEMPLASTENGNPNIEVPSSISSFRGDPGNSLLYYPRVYFDNYPGMNPIVYSYEKGTMAAGMPTETEVAFVPEEGQLNINNNPYGPGGFLQRLYNSDAQTKSRIMRTDRSVIGREPESLRYAGRFYKD